jgi:hypothetical protein
MNTENVKGFRDITGKQAHEMIEHFDIIINWIKHFFNIKDEELKS